jgi:DNA-directed RNA polymerase specialized sigma24 family protein
MEARQAAEARQQVTALYRAHALGLVKLAVLMVGDQLTAEDVVQDAFLGLYRRWSALQGPGKGSQLRPRQRDQRMPHDPPGQVPP